MLVKKRGGMTEYIPSPREKREALVRDHFAELAELFHVRLLRIEERLGLPDTEAVSCSDLLEHIRDEEKHTVQLNQELRENPGPVAGD